MALIFTDIARENTLTYLVGGTVTPESLVLKLFANDVTPTDTDDVTLYTEVSGGGYSSIALTPANWTVTAGNAIYPEQSWTFSGAIGDVYGYYLVNSVSGELIFAERFPAGPYDVATSGDVIRVTLNLNLN